jgi:hypothetical protein
MERFLPPLLVYFPRSVPMERTNRAGLLPMAVFRISEKMRSISYFLNYIFIV